MMTVTLFPIVLIAALSIAAIVALVVAVVASSPKRRFPALLSVGLTVCGVLLAVILATARTSDVHEAQTAERLQLDQQAAMRAEREQYQAAYQSQVLDYRGDSEPIVVSPVTTGDSKIEVFRYSPSGQVQDEPLLQLPAWVNEANPMDPSVSNQSFVLSSEPWSSVEEADEELYAVLAGQLGDYLGASYPAADGWQPSRADLAELPLIQDAVRETVPLEVGEHTVHVQHAYWRVQLTPEIREELFELWRPTVVQERLISIGGGLGVLTLFFAIAAGVFRMRQRPRRSARPTIAVLAAALGMTGLAGLATLIL